MPYTWLVATGAYAVVFRSSGAAWCEAGLVLNELLIAAVKAGLRKCGTPESRLLRRPPGAMDSGIYPAHFPKASTTSGMPSGHSHASIFLAVVATCAALAEEALDGRPGLRQPQPSDAVSLTFAWGLAALVVVSRTRFAGPLAVEYQGRKVAHHTVLQVLVGSFLGGCAGLAGTGWYFDAWPSWPFAALYACAVAGVGAAAAAEARATARGRTPPCACPGDSSDGAIST
eukprot:CAMPEP_0176288616 /NCGR_PEP_ID=MMETSP0121_2-20121125/54065_1 /TAXON_ID=160619 /ORGANISM="Kryptoperidinium foliaceum, Strain CCMP 1326" /LENGTH=228 /DNA_ID=CAMNT_0017629313 /DNA_START=8 /DNA_END=691 /DNA_ORIENTATION=-